MEGEKKQLRRCYSEKRKSIPEEQRRLFDQAIRRNLSALPFFSDCACVAAFCPLGAEPDLLPALEGKRLFLPRFVEEQQAYELVEISDLQNDLVIGRSKILEPRPELERADWEFVRNEVLFLVPAVAYDRRGVRLGRGGGFYDRMIAEYPGRKVGVFYQSQYSEEVLPSAEHDQKLALAVTEDKVYKF